MGCKLTLMFRSKHIIIILDRNLKPNTSMSEEPQPPAPAESNGGAPVAARQAALGEEWARVYADQDRPIDNNAELVLRNPVIYLHDVNPHELPEGLQDRWNKLLGFCVVLADIADPEPASWTSQTHGLERVQTLVHGGRISPDFRGSVGDVIRVSSDLLAESVEYLPGRTANYQANLDSAYSYLQKHHTGEA